MRFPYPALFTVFLLSGGLLAASVAFGQQQGRQALEKEKKQNIEKMNQLRTVLKKTSSEKNVSLGQLKILDQQIQVQSKQIGLLNKDIQLTESEITDLRKASLNLSRDLGTLKTEYAAMVYNADKRRQQVNPLGFLFAADNFNQLVARYRYLRQYSDARQSQVRQINRIQNELQTKEQVRQRKRQQQQGALVAKVGETKKLESLKVEKNQVVKALSEKESELRTELAESRRSVAQLESMITRLVARERAERARREAAARAERDRLARAARVEAARRTAERKRAEEAVAAAQKAGEAPNPTDVARAERPAEPEPTAPKPDERRNNNLNREETALASSFAASRNRLPWPVGKGFISDRFGRRPHGVLKGIYVENQGVDIQTSAGEGVKTVYDGIVQDVASMPGMNNVVAIQHGDYFTVYAKLRSVSVRVGQRVKARETIGTVATDKNGISEIQFQIWKEFTKLNPESWLSPR